MENEKLIREIIRALIIGKTSSNSWTPVLPSSPRLHWNLPLYNSVFLKEFKINKRGDILHVREDVNRGCRVYEENEDEPWDFNNSSV